MTSLYRKLYYLFFSLSIMLNVGPIAAYIIQGYSNSNVVVEKITLTATLFVVLIMSAMAWINKTTLRSRVWVLLLGFYFCLDNFVGPLIVIAITQILDEWIVAPAAKAAKERLVINKQIDLRNKEE